MEQQHGISKSIYSVGGIEAESAGYENFALVQEQEGAGYSLDILVSGAYCGACIQKIESALKNTADVTHVRLNFSTKRLSVSWDGAPIYANDLVRIIENLGYGVQPYTPDVAKEETQVQERFLLLCLGVAGFAMGNIMLLSVGLWTSTAESMGGGTRDFMHWISAVIALPTILFSGRPFFRSAFKALGTGHTNMDVPISIALILASGMSLYETLHGGEHVYFDSAIMLMFFLLIGRYMDFRARNYARASAMDLLSTLSGFVNVIDGEKIRRVPIRDVAAGMTVRVAMGDMFPLDGVIESGESEVDTSLVTGETTPRYAVVGDEVFAGTVSLSAPVTVKVARAAEDSLLADIVRLMEQAGQGRARYVRLADRAARLYTPVVHFMAFIAFIGWWGFGGLAVAPAMMISVTVLIITCPCALGLAVPVVQVIATGRLMNNGVLVKSGDALERLADVDCVLLDKTGTLTTGKAVLCGVADEGDMRLAVSLAVHSSHPLSRGLVQGYEGALLELGDIKEHVGKGLEGCLADGQVIRLGSRMWCGDMDAPASDQLELWLDVGGRFVLFPFEGDLRSDTKKVVQAIQKSGLKCILLSGDRAGVVEKVAQECGIEEYYAEQTPTQKFDFLEKMKGQGHKVLMIGDGLNDAPSLAGADVSMAPGTAIDMAQNAADIVFMGDEFHLVYDTYKLAVKTQALVKQNFMLAVLYNMIAIPLALAGFVTPLIAALAMSGSSLLVIGNSFRLRFGS